MLRNLLQVLALRFRGVHASFDGVRVDRRSRLQPGVRLAHHVELLDTTIDRFSSIGRYSKCHYADIGPFCSVSWDVTIGATGHPPEAVSTHAFSYRKAVGGFTEDRAIEHPRAVLGADVWVGTHVVVMPRVRIGTGAILGAGAVVTRDVAPYAVMVGAPARELRRRVPVPLIDRLLAVAWWTWPDSALRRHIGLFSQRVDENVVASLEEIAADVEANAARPELLG